MSHRAPRYIPRLAGHYAGTENVRHITIACADAERSGFGDSSSNTTLTSCTRFRPPLSVAINLALRVEVLSIYADSKERSQHPALR